MLNKISTLQRSYTYVTSNVFTSKVTSYERAKSTHLVKQLKHLHAWQSRSGNVNELVVLDVQMKGMQKYEKQE